MKIIKQELEFRECLKQRLEFICELVTPIFINGSILTMYLYLCIALDPEHLHISYIAILPF